ncbi:MAG: signal peptidase II [Planctomycetota bacterium]|nr:signal peptidase II [Planctomycetota bacterium]MDA1106190.1 signal peptidase II [Planctomycetota bacterium]
MSAVDCASTSDGPAWRSRGAWAVLLLTLAGVLALDLWSKSWAFRTVAGEPVELPDRTVVADPAFRLPWHEGVRVVPGDLLDFRLVLNHGAVFGIGQNKRWVFVTFTIVAVAAGLWVFGAWTRRTSTLSHVGLALVLAGGLGNLYDRLTVGAVRDFMHLLPRWDLPFGWEWPNAGREVFPWIFNVADVSLLVGMGLLLIASSGADRARAAARASGTVAATASERPSGQAADPAP